NLDLVVNMLSRAKRPVILAGGGVRLSKACEELERLVNSLGIPLITSLMGLDVIPHDHPSNFGLIGSYGNRFSNLTLANCDFLLILGSRLDSRQTGTRTDTFARAAAKIHVDIDANELNAKVQVDIAIKSDVRKFLVQLNNKLSSINYNKPDLKDWYKIINSY